MSQHGLIDIAVAEGRGIGAVQDLWHEYWASEGLSPDFQNFAEECRTLPGIYATPCGRLLLATVDGEPAGTAALRPVYADNCGCEAKRLFVRPRFRGHGLGKKLLEYLIEEARVAGYRYMYGDTLRSMTQALEMYKRMGFVEVEPYSSKPTPDAIYIRLDLHLP